MEVILGTRYRLKNEIRLIRYFECLFFFQIPRLIAILFIGTLFVFSPKSFAAEYDNYCVYLPYSVPNM